MEEKSIFPLTDPSTFPYNEPHAYIALFYFISVLILSSHILLNPRIVDFPFKIRYVLLPHTWHTFRPSYSTCQGNTVADTTVYVRGRGETRKSIKIAVEKGVGDLHVLNI